MPATPSDEDLLQAYAEQRDPAAFEELLRRHWAGAYRLALRCLNTPEEAEDTAQTVFLKLAQARPRQLRLVAAFRPWFRTLCLNTVRNAARSRTRRTRHERSARPSTPRTDGSRVEEEVLAGEVLEHLRRLPFELRAALTLRYLEGCSHREVGEALGCPPGTASTRIRRGLEELRLVLVGAGAQLGVAGLERLLAHDAAPPPPAPGADRFAGLESSGATPALAGPLAAAATLLLGGGLMLGLLGEDGAAPPSEPPLASAAALPTPPAAPAQGTPGDPPAASPPSPAPADPPGQAPDSSPAPAGSGDGSPAGPAAASAGAGEGDDGGSGPNQAAPAGGVFQSRVLDATTGLPIAGAQVFLVRQLVARGPRRGAFGPDARSGPAGAFACPLDRTRRLQSEAIDRALARPVELEELREHTPFDEAAAIVCAPGHRPLVRILAAAALDPGPDLLLEPGPAPAVRGRLRDATGAPCREARLRLRLAVVAPESGGLAGEGSRQLHGPRSYGNLVLETRSDDEGRFVFAGLPAGLATLGLVPGQGLLMTEHQLRPRVDGPELQLSAVAPARLRVALGASAQPLVELEAWRLDGSEEDALVSSWSRGEAAWERFLPPGRYGLAAVFQLPEDPAGAGLAEFLAGDPERRHYTLPDPIELHAGETRILALDALDADSWSELRCQVLDPSRAPLGEVDLVLERESLPGRHLPALDARTDADGRASFVALPPGGYRLWIGDLGIGTPQRLQLAGGVREVELTRAVVELTGVVVDAAGAPVSEALIASEGGASCFSAADGSFTLRVGAEEACIQVLAEGYCPLEAPTAGGQPLVLRRDRGLAVSGSLPERPRGELEVHAVFLPDEGTRPQAAAGWVEGRTFQLALVGIAEGCPGTLLLRVGGHVPLTRRVGPEETSLAFPELALSAGRTVGGLLQLPPAPAGAERMIFWELGAPAGLAEGPGLLVELNPDAEGRVEIRGLPSEACTLRLLVFDPTSRLRARVALPAGASELGTLSWEAGDPSDPAPLVLARPARRRPLVNLSVRQQALGQVLANVARMIGVRIEVAEDVARQPVDAEYRDCSWRMLVADLAARAGLRVVDLPDGGVRLEE